jgi:LL-diaminopimelate aminotransferase
MVKFAQRIGNLKPKYLFRELNEKIKRLEVEGKKVIRLSVGTPDLTTPWPIRTAITGACLEKEYYHGYPDDYQPYQGLTELREALSKDYYKKHGVKVNPDQFVIDAGAKTTLHNLPRLFVEPCDSVVLQDPAYPAYEGAIILADGKIERLPCTEENDYQPLLSDLPEERRKNVKCAYFCYPNNPTGATAKREFLKELFKEAKEFGIPIFFDVAYKDFTFDGKSAPSSLEFPEAEGNVIEIGSFSKPFSMVGDRLAWVVGSKELIEKWIKLKSFIDSGVQNYIQWGGYWALTDPDVQRKVKKNMKVYGERARFLSKALNKLGLKCRRPRATPYIWAGVCEGMSSQEFVDKILYEAHVALTPGSGFGEYGEGYFRATVFQPLEVLEEAVERMEKVLSP